MTKDGRTRAWQYHNVKLTEPGHSPYVLGHAHDITELKELQQRLENLTLTDDLTGLNNRRGFLQLANDRIMLARRSGESLLLIFADVDGLKQINDNFGHAVGSQILVETADIFRDSFRQTDVISRWGGDEFLVLLIDAANDNQEVVLARLRNKVKEFNKKSGRPYQLSISFGITPLDLNGESNLDETIAAADKAMYENKRSKFS
jgi:diguanylate cyclase (GGDEF)-like protein